MKKWNFCLEKVFLASIVHLYSELHVNSLRNRDIGAEKLFCAFAHFRQHKWKKDKNLSDSSPAMIHSDNYIEISIIILFLIREIPQKIYLAQLNAFPPAQMKNLKICIGKVFASVQVHLYSKYEGNSFRNKAIGAKRRQKTLLRTFKIAAVRKRHISENSHIAHVTFRSRPYTSAKTAWKSIQYFPRFN